MPTHICCGFCAMCVEGHSSACLTTNPGAAGAAYGYPNKGGYQGAQAELLRVPLADANCLKLPGEPGDEWEDDFVLLADAFTTGYHAAAIIEVAPSDTVAIFGAGSVGLLAAYSARLRGAARVYVVDAIPERLEKTDELGAIPVNFLHGDPSSKSGSSNRSGALVELSGRKSRSAVSPAPSTRSDSRPAPKPITPRKTLSGSLKPSLN